MRIHYVLLAVLAVLPFAFSWVYPHQLSYSVDPYERVRLCATVYVDANTEVSLACAGEIVGKQRIAANIPTIVCYDYVPQKSTTCVWSDGGSETTVKIDVFPHRILDATLAVLLVVLIIRFAVRLVKIYL